MKSQADLVVIGGGPAGLEAAIAATDAGVEVILIDGHKRLGGQYFKQLSDPIKSNTKSKAQKEFDSLQRKVQQSKITIFSETTVWDAFKEGDSWVLYLSGAMAPEILQAKRLVVAPGTYDRPIPFPGWTLPGVMTAGAVQVMIKSQRILPGQRFLLSGLGPLQLAVGAQLVDAGAEVVAVLEAAQIGVSSLRYAPQMWGQWSKLLEGWEYWRTLKRSKVPLKFGQAVIEAKGESEVSQVVTAKLDENMRLIPGTEQVVGIDTLVVGFGLQPCSKLTRLLGCDHIYVPKQMYHVPRRNGEMETSLPGVFSAGDGAGVGGVQLARIEGRIAGNAVARQLNKLTETAARDALDNEKPALARERRFAAMLSELYQVKPGMTDLATDETLLCRCSEITRKEVSKAVEDGCEDLIWTKRITRAGMGMCQGRMCGQVIARLVAVQTGKDPALVPLDKVRPPIMPVAINLEMGSENG